MRTGLTPQQVNIINAKVKKVSWLFEIDRNNDGTVDYYWAQRARSWNGHDYVYKIMSFSPLIIQMSSPEFGIIPATNTVINVTFAGHNIGGVYASGFLGASVTIRMVCSTEADGEAEIMSWRFKVVSAVSIEQVLTLECQDWFTKRLEGDYPNTPLVSDLFRADIMKSDKVCVPLAFGTPFFPIRWLLNNNTATYISPTAFEVMGDKTALFSAGQFFLAHCGSDGNNGCYVQSSATNSNCLQVARNGVDNPAARYTITGLQVGATYRVSVFTKRGDAYQVAVQFGGMCEGMIAPVNWASSPQTFTHVPTSVTEYLYLQVATSTGTQYACFDSIKVQKDNNDGTYGPNLVLNWNFGDGIGDWTPINSASLSWYLGGGIPTTKVVITAASPALTPNLATVSTDHYLLGPGDKTYTIDRARSPREVNSKSTFLPAQYTFKQDTITGSDGVNYKVVQLLCDDANKDGVNDANGFWGIVGKETYDMPCRFSRSDLVSKTNPADIAKQVFLDWGIPEAEIDDTSRAAAAAVFTARGLAMNIGLWNRTMREKFISKLFTVAGMVPQYRDKIGFKILTKVSQMTITEDIIKPGSFMVYRTYTNDERDCGYVTWQTATEPVDQVNKSLVAAKSSTSKYSDRTVEAEWILDAVKAQKAGKLALQRMLLQDKTITFTAMTPILVLEPGDMITIIPQNYGAESTSYTCQITKMTIREGLWTDVECIKFSQNLDDWDDITVNDIVVGQADTSRGYTPVYQGGTDAADAAGGSANKITGAVVIGAGGVLATNDNPAANGGFKATNSEMVCFNTSGQERFRVDYAGAAQGNVTMGNYSGGQGAQWNQGLDKFDVQGKVTATEGAIGGWTILAQKLCAAGIDIDAGNACIKAFNGGNYVKMSPAGIIGVDSVLGTTFNLPTNGDPPSFSSGVIEKCTYKIYTNSVMKTNDDPATNGGLLLDNSKFVAYAPAGLEVFRADLTGPNQGNVTFGDFANNKGIQWNLSTRICTVRASLCADDITSGLLTARTMQTKGARLTQATSAGATTVYVNDTSDFPASGTAWIYDAAVDEFTYTGKTSTTLTGCSGVLAHSAGLAVGGQFKRIIVSATDNEMHFFGDRGDGTMDELISLGIKTIGADTMIGVFGNADSTHIGVYGRSKNSHGVAGLSVDGIGVYGYSYTNYGLNGYSYSGSGIYGLSGNGVGVVGNGLYGGSFGYGGGSGAPIILQPSGSASAPTHTAIKGSIVLTSNCIIYVNTDGGTTWQKVGSQ